MRWKRALTIFLLFVSIWFGFSFVNHAFAADLSKSLELEYVVNDTGDVDVELSVEFINETGKTQTLKEFMLNLGELYPKNVELSESNSVSYLITRTDSGRGIKLIFDDIEIPGGEVYQVTLLYELDQVIESYGAVKQVSIPLISGSNLQTKKIALEYPTFWGELLYTNYLDYNKTQAGSIARVTLEDPGDVPPIWLIGNSKGYSFELTKRLSNVSQEVKSFKLFVPYSNSSQQIIVNSISPLPDKVTKDIYGNNFAWFELEANESIVVKIKGEFLRSWIRKEPTNHNSYQESLYYQQEISRMVKNFLGDTDSSKEKALKLFNLIKSRARIQEIETTNDPLESVLLAEQFLSQKEVFLDIKQMNEVFYILLFHADIPARFCSGIRLPYYLKGVNNYLYFWVEWEDEKGNIFISDLSIEKVNNLPGFETHFLDKLVLYKGGLLNEDITYWESNIRNKGEVQIPSPSIDIQKEIPEILEPGEVKVGRIIIKNISNVPLERLKIDLESNFLIGTNGAKVIELDEVLYPGMTLNVPIQLSSDNHLEFGSKEYKLRIHAYSNGFTLEQELKGQLTLVANIPVFLLAIISTAVFLILGLLVINSSVDIAKNIKIGQLAHSIKKYFKSREKG